MAKATLHVSFTPRGAENLRDALRNAGRDDRVVGLTDDFRFGPINGDDPLRRATRIRDELGLTGWGDVAAESEWFWQQALSDDHRTVAWFSRRSARNYTGFLEWLWRRGDAPCEIVDLTDRRLPQFSEHGSIVAPVAELARIAFEEIHDFDPFAWAEMLPSTAHRNYQVLWQRLREENAALRLLKGDALESSPISVFDPALLSQASETWRKVAMVVSMSRPPQAEGDVTDLFLAARIDALVASGHLERQGRSAVDMRRREVRLSQETASQAVRGSGNPT